MRNEGYLVKLWGLNFSIDWRIAGELYEQWLGPGIGAEHDTCESTVVEKSQPDLSCETTPFVRNETFRCIFSYRVQYSLL